MEIPKVYKVLVETEDGRLVSRTAGGRGWREYAELEYKEGQITYAPQVSKGVYVNNTLQEAYTTVGDRSGDKQGIRVIHEATPLGVKGRDDRMCFDTYPAILLGKEVWRDEPTEEPRPEPKFKVGDRVCFGGLKEVSTIKSVEWMGDHYAYHFNESSHFNSEEYLSLAPPKEEWVDVTKECDLSFLIAQFNKGGQTIMLSHKGNDVARIGLGEPWVLHPKHYKMEVLSRNYLDKMSTFKILKKVVK